MTNSYPDGYWMSFGELEIRGIVVGLLRKFRT
jgi:hypothetical protein